MAGINQPTAKPTNKLSAATLAAAFVEVVWIVLTNFAPDYAHPDLKSAVTPVVVFLIGYYLVKDEPNTVPDYNGEL